MAVHFFNVYRAVKTFVSSVCAILEVDIVRAFVHLKLNNSFNVLSRIVARYNNTELQNAMVVIEERQQPHQQWFPK